MASFVCGDGHDHVTHGVGGAVHHHGVGASVDDLKVNVGKGGVALGRGPHLAVLLFQVNAAPDYIVFCFVLQQDVVYVNGNADFFGESFQHTFVGGLLPHSVVAVGESVLPGGGHTAGVGGDGHGHLAGSGGGAVHYHRVLAFVNDLKGDSFQRGVALRSRTGLAVLLLYGEAASLDFLRQVRDLQLVHIAGELASIHGVGVNLGVQPVTFRGGEFLDRHRPQGQTLQSAKIAGGV